LRRLSRATEKKTKIRSTPSLLEFHGESSILILWSSSAPRSAIITSEECEQTVLEENDTLEVLKVVRGG